MPNLTETATWESGIYQIETTDPVQGGPSGISNQQGKQLANRTSWLKRQVDKFNSALGFSGTVSYTLVGAEEKTVDANTFWYGAEVTINQTDGTGLLIAKLVLDKNGLTAADKGLKLTFRKGSIATQVQVVDGTAGGTVLLTMTDGTIIGGSIHEFVFDGTNWTYLQDSFLTLVGSVHAFAMDRVPQGFLPCSGAVVSRTTYARLFAAIGTRYNTGGESGTQFRLPDLRGEFIRGWDNGRGVDSGRALGSTQGDLIKDHTHFLYSQLNGNITNGGATSYATSVGNSNSSNVHITNVPSSGSGAETRPRNVALMYCIKF